MMAKVDSLTERSAQRRVARKYKTLGYEVQENPGAELLPDFMRGVSPDIVARSSSDNVVIEVKQHASLKGSNDLVGIAERVSGHPDWRFELVVVDEAGGGPVSDAEYARLLERVHIAMSHQMFDMAFIYLTNVLVRTARDLAKKNGISFMNKADRILFLDLGFKGILPNDLLELCRSALSKGNDLAHASDKATPSADDVQSLAKLCGSLRELF